MPEGESMSPERFTNQGSSPEKFTAQKSSEVTEGFSGVPHATEGSATSEQPAPKSLARKILDGDLPMEIRGGAPWLYDNPHKLDGLEPSFKAVIQTLELTQPYSENLLREHYHDIFSFVRDGKVTAEQAAPFLSKITARLEEVERNRGRSLPRVPETPEGQRAMVIPLLERIEATDFPLKEINSDVAAEIEANFRRLNPELQEECRARIRLHDCFSYVVAISGDTEQAVKDLRSASNELASRRRALESDDFYVLLEKGLPGLKISEAFKKLEEWAILGRKVPGKSGKVRFREEGSPSIEQNKIIDDIVRELGGGEEARKSYQLAFRIAVATFETSVWNKNLQGKDVVAEGIYLRDYRQGRAKSGRDRGPNITVDKIEGFGTSFFRQATLVDKDKKGRDIPLVDRVEIAKTAFSDENQRRKKEILINQRLETGDEVFLPLESMDFRHLSQGSYEGYLGLSLPRLLNTKLLLLKTDFKVDEFTTDEVEKWIAPFKTADPTNCLKLRKYFVMGILDYGLTHYLRLGWGQKEVAQLERVLTQEIGGTKEKPVRFLPAEEMGDIVKELKIRRRAFQADWLLAFVGSTRVRR